MKLTLLLLFMTIILPFSGLAQKPEAKVFGRPFTPQQVLPAARLPQTLATRDSAAVTVTGKVASVCQAKGCWMDVELDDKTVMKVRFENYGFFVPKDLAGKTVTIRGMAYKEAVSVADQQHYARDAKKSEAEIKAITAPKQSITFTATGVKVE